MTHREIKPYFCEYSPFGIESANKAVVVVLQMPQNKPQMDNADPSKMKLSERAATKVQNAAMKPTADPIFSIKSRLYLSARYPAGKLEQS